MSRQAGKNELAAQLEAYLLTLFRHRGGDIIKAAPSFKPQVINSDTRLRSILDQPLMRSRWQPRRGYIIECGKARISFFSADSKANVVGATASILLEIDEAQDVDEEVYDRSFRPMASTTNATTVLYGTAWTEDTLLEHHRTAARIHDKETGETTVFEAPWELVAQSNPKYRAFVTNEIARLGPRHPTIRTQYNLEAITGAGRLFPPPLLVAIQGDHPRRLTPEDGITYVAGVDVAGAVREDGKPLLNDTDETVVTIAAISHRLDDDSTDEIPSVHVVHHVAMRGVTHPVQQERLAHLLWQHWVCAHVAIDATGVGAGTAAYLAAMQPNRTDPIAFTAPEKSRLGYDLLAAAETGRLKIYQDPGDPDLETCFSQLAAIQYTLKTNELMQWAAPQDDHDDYATSLALCVRAAAASSPPAAGSIIRGQDVDPARGDWG